MPRFARKKGGTHGRDCSGGGGMKRYRAADGEWLLMSRKRGISLSCCDCGLVHVFDFVPLKRGMVFRAKRDNRSTAAMRREAAKRGRL